MRLWINRFDLTPRRPGVPAIHRTQRAAVAGSPPRHAVDVVREIELLHDAHEPPHRPRCTGYSLRAALGVRQLSCHGPTRRECRQGDGGANHVRKGRGDSGHHGVRHPRHARRRLSTGRSCIQAAFRPARRSPGGSAHQRRKTRTLTVGEQTRPRSQSDVAPTAREVAEGLVSSISRC